ncbi:Conserved_hypothetical protein [Hexamita inflata]|uniref:WKF domain-containing protein n=1 Tax=Hexamita inflata TaxID=28002 RepID=A0AA86P1P3_9EUKA|nr:Conserved hypothetical protein [Hexamita inflata]CAI9932081.1 Conserved hypothetical protein [Hexamita inflata]CAI9941327.1 Conserved hypothetical protein [Hexamita inflata]CAI9970281.1 Conserved hypothetical protein [Hexamita inflata]
MKEDQPKRTPRKSIRKSEGRSLTSKYSPGNISLWLRQWKNEREAWEFKSIANDEAIRICLERDLMPKEDFDIFCEFFKTNKTYGAYKRLQHFCDEVEEEYNQNKEDEVVRNKMKRVIKIRAVLVDPRK